jgi:hypothetical protein
MNTSSQKLNKFTVYSLILLTNFVWYFFGLGKVASNLLNLDQKIMLLTASRMNYLNLDAFEATWNHHTSPINYIFKLSYFFADFLNIEYGFYIIYSFLLLLINYVLYEICYKFTRNTTVSFLLSVCFIFDLSTATIADYILFDNRTIGILFQCLILYYSMKIITKETKNDILFFSLFIFLQIAFLESYIVSCGLIFVYLFFKVKNKIQFCKIFFTFNILLATFFFSVLYFNSELLETIFLNYQFHLDAIGINSIQKIQLNSLFNYGLFKSWGVNKASYLFTFGFIVLFYLKKDVFIKTEIIKNYYDFLTFYFIFEFLHVLLTGPRFVNYLQLIILLKYLIIFISIFFILKTFKMSDSQSYILISTVLIIFFLFFQFDYFKNNRISLFDSSFKSASEIKNPVSPVSNYLFSDGSPEPILAWVSSNSWDDIYFYSNKLPATRMWWWFEMKYLEDSYNWKDGRYYNIDLDKIFIEDLLIEQPKFAIIQEGIEQPPLFYMEYIENNYIFNKKIANFLIYKVSFKN